MRKNSKEQEELFEWENYFLNEKFSYKSFHQPDAIDCKNKHIYQACIYPKKNVAHFRKIRPQSCIEFPTLESKSSQQSFRGPKVSELNIDSVIGYDAQQETLSKERSRLLKSMTDPNFVFKNKCQMKVAEMKNEKEFRDSEFEGNKLDCQNVTGSNETRQILFGEKVNKDDLFEKNVNKETSIEKQISSCSTIIVRKFSAKEFSSPQKLKLFQKSQSENQLFREPDFYQQQSEETKVQQMCQNCLEMNSTQTSTTIYHEMDMLEESLTKTIVDTESHTKIGNGQSSTAECIQTVSDEQTENQFKLDTPLQVINQPKPVERKLRKLITSCVPICDPQSQPDDKHQSKLLFIIVAVFLLCSLPRAILNLVEFEHMFSLYYLAYFVPEEEVVIKVKEAELEDEIACFYPPFWFVLFTNVSSLFMTINASLGFLIYCLGCSLFRAELSARIRRLKNNFQVRCSTIMDNFFCRSEGIHV